MTAPAPGPDPDALDALAELVRRHPRLFVLTGAGCSTGSGIPDYRDAHGNWKRRQPVQYQAFVRDEAVRRRYWAGSLLGWPRVAAAEPNAAHRALARLEAVGYVHALVTQNVDGLHQQAGSRCVTDLHGRLDRVVCLVCGVGLPRAELQARLAELNPGLGARTAGARPDGDAEPHPEEIAQLRVPPCPRCGGVLKPAVVFFGENVPAATVEHAYARLAESDALLVAGSSLMVYSGYRFCRRAAEAGKPLAAVNLGRTRADAALTLKVHADCGTALAALAARLDT
jgi:NAD-dependent SIR2 family protein deacetylase